MHACARTSARSIMIVQSSVSMDLRFLLALCLLCGLEVDSQTFPRLSFGGYDAIPNHGYVRLGTMAGSYFNSVWCRTDLTTCCTSQQGDHRGQWYFPNGQPVTQNNFFQTKRSKVVDIRRRNNPTSPIGIYHCAIPTMAVHDDNDTSVRESVYVGLYTSEGKCIGCSK